MEEILKNNEIKKESKRGKNPNSLANLEKGKWKKGQTGNPKGHPLNQKNYETLRREAIIAIGKQNGKTPEEIEIMLHSVGLSNALKGDFRFYKDDLDRVHGQATQKTELVGELKISKLEEMLKATRDILNG